jgi:hypothetical protein
VVLKNNKKIELRFDQELLKFRKLKVESFSCYRKMQSCFFFGVILAFANCDSKSHRVLRVFRS